MKKELKKKNNYILDYFTQDEDVIIKINMSFTLVQNKDGLNVVQNFTIFPPSLEKYMDYDTKIREFIHSKVLKNLYIGGIYEGQIKYSKTEIYTPCNFSVYYLVNKETNEKEFKKDFGVYQGIMKQRNWEIKFPKELLIPENEIGSCLSCRRTKDCPYIKKNKKGDCRDYSQK